MNQHQFNSRAQRSQGSGCGKAALIGGGCLAVVLIGFVGLILAGGLLWDRGTDAGENWASSWLSDRFGSDISDRADRAEEATKDLPEPRAFNNQDEYLEFLNEYHREFASSMEEVAGLLSQPDLRDDAWLDSIAGQIAIIRQLESQAHEITPPEGMEQSHEHWVTGMVEFRRALDTTASAIDDVSPSQLFEAINALNSATQSYISMAHSLDEQGVLEDLEGLERLKQIEQQP